MIRVRVQQADFDVSVEMAALRDALGSASAGIGALASFVGLVRDHNDGSSVTGMTLEHYPGMTEKALSAIARDAGSRWQVLGCTIVHRVGALLPRDQIVLVLVASGHRGDAFAACEFIMDYLKTRAPFWKKEATDTGERWVDERATDATAAARWTSPSGT